MMFQLTDKLQLYFERERDLEDMMLLEKYSVIYSEGLNLPALSKHTPGTGVFLIRIMGGRCFKPNPDV